MNWMWEWRLTRKSDEGTPAFIQKLASTLHESLSILARKEAPVVAAVNGAAAGAGMSLVCHADLAIAAESAKFSMAYTAAGLTPDGSATYFLSRMIGRRRAVELMLTNRRLSAAEALEWNFVNRVVPDDELMAEAEKLAPERVIISPGPCTPLEAGISNDIIKHFAGKVPILGVCLGHQAIGFAFGARIASATKLMHGKVSHVRHDGKRIFRGLENPFSATRYHSLAIRPKGMPPCLKVTATSEDGEIMGVRHKRFPVEGVQFHPESILTTTGKALLRNFLASYAPQ